MMIQNITIRDEYYKLVVNIRKVKPEEAIIMLTDFYNKYLHEDEDNKIKNAITYDIADNLKKQGKPVEALAKFKELLTDPLLEDLSYHNTLTCTLETLIELGQREEAIKLANDYLNREHVNPFYYLNILFWYARNIESYEEKDLEKYRPLVKKIFQDLEVNIEEDNLKKAILYLADENQKSNRKYSEVMMEYGRISNDELKKHLKEYIDSERIGYYRDLALKNVTKLEHAGK